MVEVYCTFDECIYYKPHDEEYGICTKDHITLDDRVDDVMFGCPDSEWNGQTERSE